MLRYFIVLKYIISLLFVFISLFLLLSYCVNVLLGIVILLLLLLLLAIVLHPKELCRWHWFSANILLRIWWLIIIIFITVHIIHIDLNNFLRWPPNLFPLHLLDLERSVIFYNMMPCWLLLLLLWHSLLNYSFWLLFRLLLIIININPLKRPTIT